MAVFLLYSKVYRHERIWPRDSLEAPAADDGRLLENEERLGGIIRKRKLLRLGVVAGGGVVVSPGGGGGGGGGARLVPTCAPTRLGPLALAHYLNGRRVVSIINDMIVEECRCA